MYMLGVDPGFEEMGLSYLHLTKDAEKVVKVWRCHTVANMGKKLTASENNVWRAREIHRFLEIIFRHPIDAVACEAMSFPPNASSAAKVAMVWGLLVSFTEARKIPIVQVTPKELKRIVGGRKDLSKQEVEDFVRARYPETRWDAVLEGISKSYWSHIFDSIGAGIAVLDNDLIRVIRMRPDAI